MNSDLDICIEIIQNMIIEDKRVTIFSENYKEFKEKITKYVYENNFNETPEWENTSNLMIYKSNQWLSLSEANAILVNLEKLKRMELNKAQEKIIFEKQIHPLIANKCEKKFFDGHYADAVESAFKEINTRCKNIYKSKTGVEKDGKDLMNTIFSPNNPVLQFESMDSQSGIDVQQGYMQIFAGSILGIRNPKAHENQDLTKEAAYKRLIFASLLMDKIDEAEEYKK